MPPIKPRPICQQTSLCTAGRARDEREPADVSTGWSRLQEKGGKERQENRYYRQRLLPFGRACCFASNLTHYGGNYACIQAQAYHIADTPFKIGAIFPTTARAASISSASASPGSKCRAHRDRTGDARGARCFPWSRLAHGMRNEVI